METLIRQIKTCIEEKLAQGHNNFIIFPFGDIGIQVKYELNEAYGIQETFILDNNLCDYNEWIKESSFLNKIDCKKYCLILATADYTLYKTLKSEVAKFFPENNIAELPSMVQKAEIEKKQKLRGGTTQIGRYSYGPICYNHGLIESIGSFCSFAAGTDVVMNHEKNYITTHPLIYAGANGVWERYEDYRNASFYFEGVLPKESMVSKIKRIRIGNDVWLGRNVIITNYANIGNGVIAGAGSVITKDVPDYAVVVGSPARIIKYRYAPDEIENLNRIAWWNWSDDEIRERYDDFYLPVREFIEKYKNI